MVGFLCYRELKRMMTVIILSGQSLFVEGIASRLRQFPEQVTILVIDPKDLDAIDQMQQVQPATVILDAHDTDTIQLCPLSKLIFSFPDTKILRLDSQQEKIQVVSSENVQASSVQDLLEIIQAAAH